jgi:transposase
MRNERPLLHRLSTRQPFGTETGRGTDVRSSVRSESDYYAMAVMPQKFTREELEALVKAGLSIRAIAERLGVAPRTVRKWLGRFDLQTERTVRVRIGREARETGRRIVALRCKHHGSTEFLLEGRGAFRCLQCRQDAVAKRRRRVKEILVDEAGGACKLCGYSRYVGALHFHHLDPKSKAFSLADEGATRSLAAARAEAAKCILLCANCHAEVEVGLVGYA